MGKENKRSPRSRKVHNRNCTLKELEKNLPHLKETIPFSLSKSEGLFYLRLAAKHYPKALEKLKFKEEDTLDDVVLKVSKHVEDISLNKKKAYRLKVAKTDLYEGNIYVLPLEPIVALKNKVSDYCFNTVMLLAKKIFNLFTEINNEYCGFFIEDRIEKGDIFFKKIKEYKSITYKKVKLSKEEKEIVSGLKYIGTQYGCGYSLFQMSLSDKAFYDLDNASDNEEYFIANSYDSMFFVGRNINDSLESNMISSLDDSIGNVTTYRGYVVREYLHLDGTTKEKGYKAMRALEKYNKVFYDTVEKIKTYEKRSVK